MTNHLCAARAPLHRRPTLAAALVAALLPWLGSLTHAAVPVVPAVATDEPEQVRNLRVQPPPLPKSSGATQEANKHIVLQWHYEFFDLGHFREASNKYMAEDFQQNDPNEKSGREQYVSQFEHNGYVPKKPAERPPLIAVLAEGDLVMVVIPGNWTAGSTRDPKAGFLHCNMFRVREGRIVAMWVSADAARPPVAPTPAPAS